MFCGAAADKNVDSWTDVARTARAWAPPSEDLWDSKGWTTAIRDQDDYGPFGTKGQYGVEGPPAPWVQQAKAVNLALLVRDWHCRMKTASIGNPLALSFSSLPCESAGKKSEGEKV